MKLIVIMAAFVAWLGSNSELPTPEYAPTVRVVAPQVVWRMHYPERPFDPDGGDVVFALYNDADGTIYVSDTVDIGTAWGRSVILHELVHFYQYESGRDYACMGDREREAYDIQKAWLAEQGVDIFDHINGLFMIFQWQAGCERYRLPDGENH